MTARATDVAHDHFQDVEQQADAARLGLWVFLASEVLLFTALFVLYAAMRVEHGHAFHEGIRHATKTLGSINTAVLIVSSGFVAFAVHALREGRVKTAAACTSVTIVLGLVFLAIKITEYAEHVREGILPGGHGAFFVEHPAPGLPPFWTLYYTMTGLHAVHVIVGVTVLVFLLGGMALGRVDARTAYRLECGATYWHLVDLFWLFLWPLFYLA
jgi:cytochrome c oxidase subunit 3